MPNRLNLDKKLTIAITSANCPTGLRLLERLKDGPAHTIALVREDRSLPADEVIADWTQSDEAFEALANADVVAHLSGVFIAHSWEEFEEGMVGTTRRVVEAVERSGTPKRIAYLSHHGSDPNSPNWYVKSKGMAEQVLTESATEAVIFRVSPIAHGRPVPGPFESTLLARAPGAPVKTVSPATARYRPIYIEDCVDALIAGVRGDGRPGIYDLGGPDIETTTELVARINGQPVDVELLPTPVAVDLGIPEAIVEVLAEPVPDFDQSVTTKMFGLTPTPLADIWPIEVAGAK